MREATIELEKALEYCKAILNADSEEELIEIRNDITKDLKNDGFDEEYIQTYLDRLELTTTMIESGEYIISENGLIARNPEKITELQGVPAESEVNSMSNTPSMAGVGLGVTLTALVATLSLKKRVLKNKKTKNR